MSATLVAKDLAAGHGERVLFSGLDLVVAPGDVIGLVGANGAGKSTLLRLLAGLDTPEDGTLALGPPTATVGHLPQEPDRRPGETVRAFLARRTGVTDAQLALDTATEALVEERPGADDTYATALERWLALGAADLDERAEEIAGRLGLTIGLDQPMTTPPAARPPAPRSPHCCSPVTTSSCWTSRPTTSTWTASDSWRPSSPGFAPAPSWSATTASS